MWIDLRERNVIFHVTFLFFIGNTFLLSFVQLRHHILKHDIKSRSHRRYGQCGSAAVCHTPCVPSALTVPSPDAPYSPGWKQRVAPVLHKVKRRAQKFQHKTAVFQKICMSKKRTELPPIPFYRYADQITVGSMVNVLLIQLFSFMAFHDTFFLSF